MPLTRSPSSGAKTDLERSFLWQRGKNLTLLCSNAYALCLIVTGFLTGVIVPLLLVFEKQLTEDATKVSMVYTVCWIGYGFGSVAGGILVDKVKKCHLVHGILMVSASLLLITMQYVQTLFVMCLFWFYLGSVVGCSESIVVVCLCRISSKNNGTILYSRLQIIYTAALAAAAIVYKFQMTWIILCGMSIIYSIVVIFILPTPERHITIDEDKTDAETSASDALEAGDALGSKVSVYTAGVSASCKDDEGEKLKLLKRADETYVADDSSLGFKLMHVFLPLSLLFMYNGSRTSLAFVDLYCLDILGLHNGNAIGQDLISSFYYGLLISKLMTPFLLARFDPKQLILCLSVAILLALSYLSVLQFVWHQEGVLKVSQPFLVCSLYAVFAVNGFCSGPIYNVVLRLFECFREMTGIVPSVVLVAFAVGTALSGYGSGLFLDHVGYDMIAIYSAGWILAQIGLIVLSLMILRKMETKRVNPCKMSPEAGQRRVMRYKTF